MLHPFKITVSTSAGSDNYTAYGYDVEHAASELVGLVKLQHPGATIYNMTAPFQNIPQVW